MKQYRKDNLKYLAIRSQLFIATCGMIIGLLMAGAESMDIMNICINTLSGLTIFIISIFYAIHIINKYELDKEDE